MSNYHVYHVYHELNSMKKECRINNPAFFSIQIESHMKNLLDLHVYKVGITGQGMEEPPYGRQIIKNIESPHVFSNISFQRICDYLHGYEDSGCRDREYNMLELTWVPIDESTRLIQAENGKKLFAKNVNVISLVEFISGLSIQSNIEKN